MPRVATEGGIEFVVHAREQPFEPPHVHVFYGGIEVRIDLDRGQFMDDPPRGKAAAIMRAYRKHAVTIRDAWEKYHKR
jgi:hypothetical protein